MSYGLKWYHVQDDQQMLDCYVRAYGLYSVAHYIFSFTGITRNRLTIVDEMWNMYKWQEGSFTVVV